MRPIETIYRGWRFRSRLEARWAVYLDAVGLRWEYELQGYDLGGLWYLPDFWLPEVRSWAEVKPEPFTPLERDKVNRLVIGSGKPCLLLVSSPDLRPYEYVEPSCEGGPEDSPGIFNNDAVVSSSYADENRLYAGVVYELLDERSWPDVAEAVRQARSARFERR